MQKLIHELYHHHDSRRGVENTLDWFITEVYELYLAVKNKANIEDEMADVLAWLLSLANLLNINLEDEFIRRYGGKCPKCMSIPCICDYRERPNKNVKLVKIQ